MTPVNPPPLDRTSPPRRTDAWRQPDAVLPEGVRVRVLRAVYGDPRAAAELAPRLTDRQATGVDPLPTSPAELAPSLLRERRAEIRALPDDTRLLLLLAAADQYPVPTDAFLRAVMAARLDTRLLDAAEAAGIAHAGAGGVVFRDAWTRIAAYETGSPADRRDVHRLLARVLRGEGETPWRSWHRGAGALGPSARLAAELGAAAGKAGEAGRLSVARALAERAAALCPDPSEQARLLARAAAYAWRSGDGDRARRLAAAVSDDALSGVLALRAGNAAEAFDALLMGVVRAAAGGAGATGVAGVTEPTGVSGVTEPAGVSGVVEPTGVGDVAGPTGAAGVTEPAGVSGVVEPTGVGDVAGPAGAAGVTEPAGVSGVVEPTGVGDVAGPAGAAGVTEPAGVSGVVEPTGVGDVAGPAGAAGVTEPTGAAELVVSAGVAVPSTSAVSDPDGADGAGSAVAADDAGLRSAGPAARASRPTAHGASRATAHRATRPAVPAASPTVVTPTPTRTPTLTGPLTGTPTPAAHLLARVTEAAIYTGDVRRLREAARVADRHGLVPPGTLTGLVAAFDGRYEDARDLLKSAAGRCGPGGDPTVLIHAGIAALLLGDHTRAATATVRAAASARALGTPVTVPQAMEFRAYADFWTGRPRAGEAAAADALWQAHATGQDNGACHLQAALAMFAALTGDAEVCHERAATARSYALTHGLGLPAALAQWALAFLDLSSGRFAAAAARLRALAGFGPGHGHRAVRHLATPHYVEAAVRTGDTRVARVAHADYHRWASTVRSPDDLALSARCGALLAPGEEAVEHYRTALDLHSHGTRDFERARTELLFGSALRRLRRRTEARDRLHSALEAFDSFGAPHCAAQARTELRALGTPAAPAPAGLDATVARLTAQQLLVARMAAEGATNREIAGRLALSPRTIDHHLRGVFTRLGIRSRIELVRLLAESDESEAV
ncbi:LuxR C-terminal-related transcriptional regulator [Streptomyces shaanxiensis]|uniref:LuxR C-terminal-related transcriptional regulator n=1 Tax=Streptomyces shaanxiensis TaxID=653357 RepID=UPI0031EA1F49